MAKKDEQILKETKYCKIFSVAVIEDDEYNSCIERIEVKDKKREEIRFALYKDTIRESNCYIPRSIDVTEMQLLELMKKAIQAKVFSSEFVQMLKQELDVRK